MSFPTIDKMASMPGKKEGEVRVFRDGGVAKAFAWQGGVWVLMGDVQGQAHPKVYYPGDKYFPAGEYDYVFDVQDDSGISKKLPFNDGENPLTSAEKFLVREGMFMDYKDQIRQFIMKNSRSQGKIGKVEEKPKAQAKKLSAIREMVFHRQMNLEGLNKTLLDFNQALLESQSELAIPESQVKHINSLIIKLKDPKIYSYIGSFTSFEQALIPQLVRWPAEKFVPVLDLMRIMVCHHASGFFFSGLDSGLSIMVGIISKLGDAKPVVWKLFFKFLSNLGVNVANCVTIVKSQDILFDCFAKVPFEDNGVVSLLAAFLMTFSSNFDVTPSSSPELAGRFNSLIGILLSQDSSGTKFDFDITSKLAIAVINFSILGKNKSTNATACAQNLKQRIEKDPNASGPAKTLILDSLNQFLQE